MTERFTTDAHRSLSEIYDDGRVLTNKEVIKYLNWYRRDMLNLSVENEQLKKELEQLKKDIEYKERVIQQYQQNQIENIKNCSGDSE